MYICIRFYALFMFDIKVLEWKTPMEFSLKICLQEFHFSVKKYETLQSLLKVYRRI